MNPDYEKVCVPLAGDKPGEFVGTVIYFKYVVFPSLFLSTFFLARVFFFLIFSFAA